MSLFWSNNRYMGISFKVFHQLCKNIWKSIGTDLISSVKMVKLFTIIVWKQCQIECKNIGHNYNKWCLTLTLNNSENCNSTWGISGIPVYFSQLNTNTGRKHEDYSGGVQENQNCHYANPPPIYLSSAIEIDTRTTFRGAGRHDDKCFGGGFTFWQRYRAILCGPQSSKAESWQRPKARKQPTTCSSVNNCRHHHHRSNVCLIVAIIQHRVVVPRNHSVPIICETQKHIYHDIQSGSPITMR